MTEPVLHLVSASDPGPALLRARPGDALLLIGEGVYGVAAGGSGLLREAVQRGVRCHVLWPDAEARGVPLPGAGIVPVDDAGFVALVVEHRHLVSWS